MWQKLKHGEEWKICEMLYTEEQEEEEENILQKPGCFNYQTKLCHIPEGSDLEEGTSKCKWK